MPHPKRQFPLRSRDILLEVLAAVGLLVFIGFTAANYSDLPEQVPHHFNLAGEPDAYGSKKLLWVLVGIGGVLYAFLTVITRYPHTFNYKVEITEKNAEEQYRLATRMIRSVKTIITWGFFYIVWSIVQTAYGKQDSLGIWFLVLFLVLIFGVVGFFLYKSRRQTM